MKRMAKPAAVLLVALTLNFVGCVGEEKPAATSETASVEIAPPSGQMMEVKGKINLNTASKEIFLAVPGVGDRMVREFMEYRPYNSIGQFRREMGKYVDEAQVAEYEKFLYVPADPNNSDAETMMQIPGIDQSVVDELDLLKPFPTKEAFMEALTPFVKPEQLLLAATYLMEE